MENCIVPDLNDRPQEFKMTILGVLFMGPLLFWKIGSDCSVFFNQPYLKLNRLKVCIFRTLLEMRLAICFIMKPFKSTIEN